MMAGAIGLAACLRERGMGSRERDISPGSTGRAALPHDSLRRTFFKKVARWRDVPPARGNPPRSPDPGELARGREDSAGLESRFGAADHIPVEIPMHPWEFALLRHSKLDGRYRDATIFIPYEGKLVCIVKHAYPDGVARPPSGGVCPGESLQSAAEREAWEETGLRVRIRHYLTRVTASFHLDPDARPLANPLAEASHKDWTLPESPPLESLGPEYWESHVFWAEPTGGHLGPQDTNEVKEIRLVLMEELEGPVHERMRRSGVGGFQYRVRLQEAAIARIRALGLM